MSISEQIARITKDRNTIRTKLISLGLADTTSNLDTLAAAVDGIVNQGAVQAEVLEGATYTIPAGYHNGSGTVTGLSDIAGDAAKYKLQQKTVEPTKKQQSIKPDSGFYGLSSVTVESIPAEYQDVTSVTATAPDVVSGKVFVSSDGTVTVGTMPYVTTKTTLLTTKNVSYTIPKGYHNGEGVVMAKAEPQTATPTKSVQVINAQDDGFLTRVTIEAIPDEYIITALDEDVAAGPSDIFTGKSAYVNGKKVDGTMRDNGSVSVTLDTTTTSYTVPAGYHNGRGTVSISTETKTATPTTRIQTIIPSAGKVLSSVTVSPIPSNYITTTDATAAAEDILLGKTAYINSKRVTGTMANNGAVSGTIDGLATTSFAIPAGYTTGGTISLTKDIENQLAAI